MANVQIFIAMDKLIEEKYYKMWQSFSYEVEEDYKLLIQEAEKYCIQQLEKIGFNFIKTVELWGNLRKQITEIIEKTDKKWFNNEHQKSLRPFYVWEEEDSKINQLKKKLYRSLDRFQLHLEGKLAQNIFKYVTENFQNNLICENCNKNIEFSKDVFKKRNITCNNCNELIEYNPGEDIDEINELLTEKLILSRCIPEYINKELAFSKVLNEIVKNKTVMLCWGDFKHAYFLFYRKYFEIWKQLSSDSNGIEENWKRREEEYEEFEMLYRGSSKLLESNRN